MSITATVIIIMLGISSNKSLNETTSSAKLIINMVISRIGFKLHVWCDKLLTDEADTVL